MGIDLVTIVALSLLWQTSPLGFLAAGAVFVHASVDNGTFEHYELVANDCARGGGGRVY
jgi:hypothetical protein